MSSLTVTAEGQRCSVKLTPLQPLSVAVDQARQKLNLVGVGSILKHGNSILDLNLPLRFAGLPAGAKLELQTGAARQLGVQASSQSTSSSQLPADHASLTLPAAVPPASAPPAVPQNQPPPHSTPRTSAPLPSQARAPADAVVQPGNATAQQQLLPTNALPNTCTDFNPVPGSSTSLSSSFPSLASTSAPATQLGSSSSAQKSFAPVPWTERNLRVFSRIAAERQASADGSSIQDEPPPDFYDFTAEDYHRVMAGKAQAQAKANAGLKTSALRKAEMEAAAARFGPVPIRVHFPDDVIVQAEFRAAESLASLRELVQQIVSPHLSRWQLHTAPPKQFIRDWAPTLFEAGLVPAAHVYFSSSGSNSNGSTLKAEVQQLMAEPPQKAIPSNQDNSRDAASSEQARQMQPGGAAQNLKPAAAGGRSSGTDGKMPKWMKIGK